MGDFNRGSKRGSGRRGSGRGGSGRRDSGRGFDRGPRRGGFGGPKEMHKAVCAECGQECEVPFKPSGDRPVYCKECFRKKKGF